MGAKFFLNTSKSSNQVPNLTMLSVVTGPPDCTQLPNVARTISCKALNSPAEYPSWKARCVKKGTDGTMLNPIFRKKVQGQKHPWRLGIVEHKIPSIKVLFKINAKSRKHPGYKLLSSESKIQLVNQRNKITLRRGSIWYGFPAKK